MKKVLSFTLATLASAALSLPVVAHESTAKATNAGNGFAVELNGFYTEFGNSGTDYLRLTPAAAPLNIETRFHNMSHDLNGGGRISFTENSERTYLLKGYKFDTAHRETYIHAVGTPGTANVPSTGMAFAGVLAAANNDFINSDVKMEDTVIQVGVERKLHLLDQYNFNADWEVGVIYQKGERNIIHTWDNNVANPIVAATVQHHRDTTTETFKGYGAYIGASGHATPFGKKCVAWFGQTDVGLLWADNDFSYLHEMITGTGAFVQNGNSYATSTDNTLVRFHVRTGMSYIAGLSSAKAGIALFVDYTNTVNAFKNSSRIYSISGTRGTLPIDLNNMSFGLSFAIGGRDANLSFEAR